MPKADEYTKALGADKLIELYSKYPVYPDDLSEITRERQLENMVLNFGPQHPGKILVCFWWSR